MAMRRLQSELQDLETKPMPNVNAKPLREDDLFYWKATITGPKNTPYYKGKYELEMRYPHNYPFQPPTVRFLTKIYASNVDDKGEIGMKLLTASGWSPAVHARKLLCAIIYSVFAGCGSNDRGYVLDDGHQSILRPELHKLYKERYTYVNFSRSEIQK